VARYDTYTRYDDRIAEDLDIGFIGFNNRLRPDQLTRGILSDSKNGRMTQNGEWQTRKGVDNIKAPLTTNETAFQVPFFLINDATGYTSNSLAITSQKLHITVNQDLTSNLAVNMTGIVFIDTDNLTGITLAKTNHKVTITAIDSVSATFRVDEITYTSGTPGGTVDLDSSTLNDTLVNEIYGSCIFSDPNSETDSYIILAANSQAIAIKISDPSTQYTMAYPATETISEPVDMIQAFNKLIIFRKGDTPFEKDLSATNINTNPQLDKVQSGEYSQPVQIVCASGEYAQIENRGIVHQSDGVSVGDTISVIGNRTIASDQDSGLKVGETFVVAKVFIGGSTTSITNATKSSTAISGGEYDGFYKVTLTAAGHTKNVGDPIDITGFGDTKIDGSRFVAEVNGNNVIVYVPQNPSLTLSGDETLALAHGFEFYIDSAKTDLHITDGASLSATPVFTRKVSEGLGFTHMPAPEYGIYHQKRLAVPYRYSVSDTADTYADRKIFDEILISDILDTDTYDQVYGQFRFNAGKSDFNVGMHSFSDDKLIVFNRNSIHLVSASKNLGTAVVQLLTDEVGLVARKSVIQVGNQVLFLSDNGVYGANFIDLYNLRGNELPLSESIQKTINDINKDAADKSVAVYFDNKYYLAVPLNKRDSDGNLITATANNALLIYNFLNKSWESIDNINNILLDNVTTITNFEFTNLLVAGKGSNRGVYVVNTDGGIHKLEVFEDGIDRVITDIGETSKSETRVQGSATSRMFTLKSIDRKKFNNFELHLQSGLDNSSNVSISATTENIDSEPALDLKTAEFYLGEKIKPDEDVSIRGRIGNKRAYGLQMTLESTLGRPRFRSLKIAGAQTNNSTSSVQ
jgi:hypothetical protein